MALSISCLVAALGISIFINFCLLSLFSAPVFAASYAASLPAVPICALTQAKVQHLTRHFRFFKASAVFKATVLLI